MNEGNHCVLKLHRVRLCCAYMNYCGMVIQRGDYLSCQCILLGSDRGLNAFILLCMDIYEHASLSCVKRNVI